MKRKAARALFAELAQRDEDNWELDYAALLIAAEEYPHLEIEKYLAQLDALATVAAAQDDKNAEPLSRLLQLNQLLFDELNFRGNTEDYFDARNSFLNDVIDRRTGIPITLSIVYIEIARRLGLRLFGVGMPGHFLVKYDDGEQVLLLDPFNGGRLLTEQQCRLMIEEMYDGAMPFQSSFLHVVTKKQILTRMLQNLKGIYARAKDHQQTLAAIERVLLINPELTAELRDRGLVYFGMGRYAAAQADLKEYLRRAPEAEDVKEIKTRLAQLRQLVARFN